MYSVFTMNKIFTCTLGLSLVVSCYAETYYLKNGKVVVGTSRELPNGSLEIKSKVGGVISFKTVTKREISRITKEDLEKVAYQKIVDLLPVPDLMSTEWYAETLDETIGKFYKDYPRSKLSSKVKKVF